MKNELPVGAEIKITVATNGSSTIEVKGIKGDGCIDLTKDLEKALGKKISDRSTRERSEEAYENSRIRQR